MEDPRRDPYAPPKRTQPGPLPQRAPDDELLWKRRILKATAFLGVVYAFLAVDRLIPIGKWGLDPTRSLHTLESYCILLSGIKLSLQLAGSIGLIATRRWGARLFLAAGAVTILQRLIIGDLPWQSVLFFAACGFVLCHHGKYQA